ncbi:MAG: dimethyladenosine transferase [Acidimicrobiales bacterium]|nr:dimethyladenosine transferase [Acidimicrobiales bacterium]
MNDTPDVVPATNDKSRKVTWGSRFIPARAEAIFDVLANPAKHHLIDGSGSVVAARSGNPERLSLGAKFGMDMKMGFPYKISSTVSAFEENRLIEWHHFGRHKWRYELEPVAGGTRVTESFNYGSSPASALLVLAGYPERHRKSIDETLQRMADHFG